MRRHLNKRTQRTATELEDILEGRWNTRISGNTGKPKETHMDIEKLTTEELQAELDRRESLAMRKEIQKRDRIGHVLVKACNEVPGFRELLVPNEKSELYQAIFGSSMDYEISLSCFHNPLREDNR